jgi:lipoprotein-anchoring transpeptidase ErfK/SrfK
MFKKNLVVVLVEFSYALKLKSRDFQTMSLTLIIHGLSQHAELIENNRCIMDFPVSTAKNGLGEQNGSGKTPRGKHTIRAKIGEGLPINTVFKGRRPTGEIYTPELGLAFPNRDWILTRILWLSGLEIGKNRLGEVDTMRRYIYLHGTSEENLIGKPRSHGCIRLKNEALISLFSKVKPGTAVNILED